MDEVGYLFDYSLHTEVKKILGAMGTEKEDDVMFTYNTFYHLRQRLKEHRYDVIVLLLDFEDSGQYAHLLKMVCHTIVSVNIRSTFWKV